MYEMAKKAREAMRSKAKRLAGEKDSKTDSSDFTPAAPLNADVKTGMRPISKQGFKRGGKIAGAKAETHAGRKPRKAGGRAITADSLINRDQKEANDGREGKKHIGGMKKGGRAGKAMGGGPAAGLTNSMNPQAYIRNVLGPTMGLKKGGKAEKAMGGQMDPRMAMPVGRGAPMPVNPRMLAMLKKKRASAAPMAPPAEAMPPMKKGGTVKKAGGGGTLERIKNPNPSPDYQPSKPNPDYQPEGGPSQEDKDALKAKIEETRKSGGRAQRKSGGNVNFGPMEMPAGKKGMSTSEQVALEKKQDAASKPTRGKAGHYADGGPAPYGMTAPVPMNGPANPVAKNALNFGMGASGSPYKKGGMAKHEDVAEDKALIRKMVKPAARTAKFGGGALSDGHKKGGKGKTNINILINPGSKPDAMGAGAPGMPPGLPPKPTGGVPVPMGMPPAGGAPPMGMPMPGPAGPAGPAGMPGGMPPMGRKAGGKVYKSYKDLDAGAGSGLGRLEKTEIQKRKG